MNEDYAQYGNRATFVASVCFRDKVKELRKEYPNLSILQLKRDIVKLMVSQTENSSICQFIHVAADEVDWEFLYYDI